LVLHSFWCYIHLGMVGLCHLLVFIIRLLEQSPMVKCWVLPYKNRVLIDVTEYTMKEKID
jgi:hypothetical protein